MRDEGLVQLKQAVVEVLNGVGDDTTLEDLLKRLGERGVTDDTAVKAAIWHLIADGEVELTSRRTLRIPEGHRSEFVLAT